MTIRPIRPSGQVRRARSRACSTTAPVTSWLKARVRVTSPAVCVFSPV